MFKKIFFTTAFLLLSFVSPSFAFKPETFVSVVHLVNSDDPSTLQNIKLAYQSSTPSAIFNDWLLTTDSLKSATLSGYFKSLVKTDKLQSVGLFISPQKQPLDKMTIEERKVELDAQLNNYFSVFGNYPRFVSAQIMDTQSLNYLQKKYGVLSFVFLPGQHPDVPANAGGYMHAPYIASSKNFFFPSSSTQNRNPVAVSQAMYLNQDTLVANIEFASQKQFNEFTQITFWTNIAQESDSYLKRLKQTYSQIKSISDKYSLNQKSIADFSDWYLNRYPESTPAFYFKDQANHTYQSPWYRIDFSVQNKQLSLSKVHTYTKPIYDPSYSIPNPGQSGLISIPTLDLSSIGQVSLQDDLYYARLKNFDYWKMSLKNETQELVLDPQSIIFKNILAPNISSKLIKVTKKDNQVTWTLIEKSGSLNLGTIVFILLVLYLFISYLKKNKTKPPFFGLLLVLISTLVSLRSGQTYPFGMGFWGPHGHDAIFHLSLIQKFSSEAFNLSHPQIAGFSIANYHLLFDYFSAILVSFFNLDIINYYFIYFPLISGALIVLLLDKLLSNFNYTKLQKNLSFLFVFFGSSLGFLARYFQNHDYLTGESAFWSNQSVSMFLNPPFILSIVFLLAFLDLHFKKPKSPLTIILLVALGGILAQTKVYAFILLCLALFLNKQIFLSALVGVFGTILSLPFSSLGGSPFILNPLWFVRSMFESADRLYVPEIASAWQVFEVSGSFPKVLVLSSIGLVVFIVGNLGVRTLGLIYIFKESPENKTDALIRKIIFLSLILPLFVTQSVNPWNSIQFLYYGLFFLGLYTARLLPKSIIILTITIFFGVFGSVGTIRDYLTQNSSSRISQTELMALSTLKDLPSGIVLSPLHVGRTMLFAPQPLYDYTSTAYISALTGKQEYLSDTINLDITGVDYNAKKVNLIRFYNTQDLVWAKQFLQENNVMYVYETPLKKLSLTPSELGLISVFTSGEVNLYQVAK